MDYADLREGIYDQLCTIPAVSNRVFWGWTAPADTEKPFLAMVFTSELPDLNTPLGMLIQLEVACYGEPYDIIALDPVADAVLSALHNQTFNTPDGRVIRPEYLRTSRFDDWDEDLKASVIRLRFIVPSDVWV